MKKLLVFLVLAGLCLITTTCGSSGGGGSVPTSAAANVGISRALGAAFNGAFRQTQSAITSADFGGPVETESITRALSEVAISAADTGTSSCGSGCTSSSGTARFNCSISAPATSCTSGGSVSGGLTINLTENCATRDVTGDFSLAATFNNCSEQGITLNGNLTLAVTLSSSTNATVSLRGTLQISGNYCNQSLNNASCAIDVTGTVTYDQRTDQTSTNFRGNVCGCDINRLSASQNICAASC